MIEKDVSALSVEVAAFKVVIAALIQTHQNQAAFAAALKLLTEANDADMADYLFDMNSPHGKQLRDAVRTRLASWDPFR